MSPVHPVPEGDSVSLGCKLRKEDNVSSVIFYKNNKVIQSEMGAELKISSVL